MNARRPLDIGVIIDLCRRDGSGGHVKCWERLAEAAATFTDELRLTLHFLGQQSGETRIADNVVYRTHPPRLSSARIPFLNRVADHTDLAARNPALEPCLTSHDLIHCTHPPFALSNTGLNFAERSGVPVSCSVHTDTVEYTRVFTGDLIRQFLGAGVGEYMLKWSRFDTRRARAMQAKILAFWGRCDWIVVSREEDENAVRQSFPDKPLSYLRRGIDKERFHPGERDRQRLQRRYGIPHDKPVLLYVGRLDDAKQVMSAARIVDKLRAAGVSVHGLFVGAGPRQADIQAMLGDDATLPGALGHAELPWHYASSDVFLFPSPFETYGNVVLEAKACGLPVMVADRGGTRQLVHEQGEDGFALNSNALGLWCETLHALLADRQRMQRMGTAARRHIEDHWPTWEAVLREDLLAVWQSLIRGRGH